MDVRIRACIPCYTRRVAAYRLKARLQDSLGVDVPIEDGYKGQFSLVIDGQLVEPPRDARGFGMPFEEVEGWLFREVQRRAEHASELAAN
jgi:hypothetical protein